MRTTVPWSGRHAASGVVGTQAALAQATDGAAGQWLLQGTVVLPAQDSELLSAPVAAVVQSVLVAPMDSVRAGQPLARLLSPQLAEWQRDWLLADAQERLALEKLQRDEQLLAEGIIAEHRRNESRTQFEMAQLSARERYQALRLAGVSDAALTQAARSPQSASLAPTLILVAPVAGIVLDQSVTPGQRVEAGAPVLRIAKAGRLAVELQASRQQALAVRIGDAVLVDGCTAAARITAVAPQMQGSSQSVLLRAQWSAPTSCVRVGQFVQARVAAGAGGGAGARVPAQAVVQHEGRSWIFVRSPEGFRAVPVQAGPATGALVDVAGDVAAGQQVAVRGVAALKGAWLGLGEQSEPARPAASSPGASKAP